MIEGLCGRTGKKSENQIVGRAMADAARLEFLHHGLFMGDTMTVATGMDLFVPVGVALDAGNFVVF